MKDYTLQGCPNLAHDKLSRSMKDIPSPRKTRSVSESRFTRHFDNGKTRPAKPPDAPTIPIGAAHILFSGQHRISEAYRNRRNPSCQGMVPHGALVWTNTQRSTVPGGKIKMTLESAEPKGKRLRWQMVKPRLGLAGGVLFKANCQGGPINHPTALGTQNPGT